MVTFPPPRLAAPCDADPLARGPADGRHRAPRFRGQGVIFEEWAGGRCRRSARGQRSARARIQQRECRLRGCGWEGALRGVPAAPPREADGQAPHAQGPPRHLLCPDGHLPRCSSPSPIVPPGFVRGGACERRKRGPSRGLCPSTSLAGVAPPPFVTHAWPREGAGSTDPLLLPTTPSRLAPALPPSQPGFPP